jgi:hypothetical protein
MSVSQDLKDALAKVEEVVSGLENADPTLAEKVFAAVEQVFLDAGYTAPAAPAE